MLSAGCEACLVANILFEPFFFQLISEKLLDNTSTILENNELHIQQQLNICKFLVCWIVFTNKLSYSISFYRCLKAYNEEIFEFTFFLYIRVFKCTKFKLFNKFFTRVF